MARTGLASVMAPGKSGTMTAATLLHRIDDARSFAQVVIETVREPLLVLDGDLNIQLASGSFHRYFALTSGETQDEGLFALDNGAWETPGLRDLAAPVPPPDRLRWKALS